MSYIEISRQNDINAKKARALDDLQRGMETEQAIKAALSAREQERVRNLISEFSPTQRDYELQQRNDELDRRLGRPLSQRDYSVAARNWVPSENDIQQAVQKQLQSNNQGLY